MKKKTRCYIYTRVSTAIQVDGYSLDVHRRTLSKSDRLRAAQSHRVLNLCGFVFFIANRKMIRKGCLPPLADFFYVNAIREKAGRFCNYPIRKSHSRLLHK